MSVGRTVARIAALAAMCVLVPMHWPVVARTARAGHQHATPAIICTTANANRMMNSIAVVMAGRAPFPMQSINVLKKPDSANLHVITVFTFIMAGASPIRSPIAEVMVSFAVPTMPTINARILRDVPLSVIPDIIFMRSPESWDVSQIWSSIAVLKAMRAQYSLDGMAAPVIRESAWPRAAEAGIVLAGACAKQAPEMLPPVALKAALHNVLCVLRRNTVTMAHVLPKNMVRTSVNRQAETLIPNAVQTARIARRCFPTRLAGSVHRRGNATRRAVNRDTTRTTGAVRSIA